MTPIFNGKVEKGRLKLNNPEKLSYYLAGLSGDVEMLVRKPKKERSNEENRYYWGVCVKMIADYCGYIDPNDAHMALRELFLTIQERPRKTRSTTTLSTVEMEEYLSRIRAWASSELNLYIPEPNEGELAW